MGVFLNLQVLESLVEPMLLTNILELRIGIQRSTKKEVTEKMNEPVQLLKDEEIQTEE